MKNELKCIILDDEQISRDTLKSYLDKYTQDITVLALCKNVQEGIEAIQKYKPDVVFLDIEMPYGDGFDLLERVEEINFDVVFITAFSNYAIKALNMSATYYILKPIDIDELTDAIKKIRAKKIPEGIQTKVLLENLRQNSNVQKQIILPNLSGFTVVKISSILRIEADNNYSTVYLMEGNKHVVSKTLKFFEELLADSGFLRIHQSHLINAACITEFKKGKNGQVCMSDGTWLDISGQRKKEFLDYFKDQL